MNEFMLFIYNSINHHESFSDIMHHEFLKKCERYINKLQDEGKLIAAQPLLQEGVIFLIVLDHLM